VALKWLEAANWLIEGVKAELNYERIIFQGENGSLLHELEQGLTNKAVVEK